MKQINKPISDFGPIVISPNQLNMFPDYPITIPIPSRPTRYTMNQEPVYESITKIVMEWAGENPSHFDRYLKITKKAITNFNDDAYYLAREYERAGCASDSVLVNLLEGIHDIIRSVLETQTKEWISKYEIKMDFAVGDIVEHKELKDVLGQITSVNLNTNTVRVRFEIGDKLPKNFSQALAQEVLSKKQ